MNARDTGPLGMPGVLWKRQTIPLVVLALAVALRFLPVRWGEYEAAVAETVGTGISIAWMVYNHWVVKRRMFAHSYELCLRCGRSLRELPDDSVCAGCGAAFHKDDVATAWKRWFRV